MSETQSTRTALLWSTVLGLTAILGSYGLACVFPFAAFAALAAITLPTRKAILLTGSVWAVNQIVGFALLGYAQGEHAAAWGIVIGMAALVALTAAKLAAGKGALLLSFRSAIAIVAAIAGYQAVMFAGASALDGFASSTPEIVATVARNDLLWFAGLATLRVALMATLPRWFGSATALRAA